MRSDEDILSLYKERRKRQARTLQIGATIQKIYDGDFQVTLPELERTERSQIFNIIQQGTDQHTMRVASVLPFSQFAPMKDSKLQRGRADDKKLVIQGWWHANRMPRKLRRRARHLLGLATSPVYLRPGDGIPKWEVMEPLATFPAMGDPDEYVPSDCIFSFRRPFGYLKRTYPNMNMFPLTKGQLPSDDMLIDVLQYCDDQEFVMLAVTNAQADPYAPYSPAENKTPAIRLQRAPNLAGRPCVVTPGRISMSRLQGQFDQLIGMYESQGYVWAMHLHALKRAIFGETWLVGRPNETPNVVATADSYSGDIGVVEGGVLQEFRTDTNVQTLQTLDRQERNQRLTGDVPAELGGESGTNIRTARRGGQVLSSAVDFPVQEHQEILADSLHEEDRIAIDIARAYWPTTTKTLVVPFSDMPVTYTPEQTFEGDDVHLVSYAYAGADTGQLVVEAGQRAGMGTLSKESFMEIDPMVRDVVRETSRLNSEALKAAHLNSIQQQAANPEGPYQPADLARLIQLVQDQGLEPYEAEIRLQKEMQGRQQAAATGQLPPEQMQPGNAIPGAPGTAQAAQPVPGVAPPTQGQQNLALQIRDLARGAHNPAPQ